MSSPWVNALAPRDWAAALAGPSVWMRTELKSDASVVSNCSRMEESSGRPGPRVESRLMGWTSQYRFFPLSHVDLVHGVTPERTPSPRDCQLFHAPCSGAVATGRCQPGFQALRSREDQQPGLEHCGRPRVF